MRDRAAVPPPFLDLEKTAEIASRSLFFRRSAHGRRIVSGRPLVPLLFFFLWISGFHRRRAWCFLFFLLFLPRRRNEDGDLPPFFFLISGGSQEVIPPPPSSFLLPNEDTTISGRLSPFRNEEERRAVFFPLMKITVKIRFILFFSLRTGAW